MAQAYGRLLHVRSWCAFKSISMNFYYVSIQSRPSVFSSSHHQHQPYTTVVNPEPPLIPNSNVFQWSTSTSPLPLPSSSHQQSIMANQHSPPSAFSPLSIPQTGIPWKCPDWMVNQNIQPGSYMNFNGQQQTRLPFKRKGEPEIETYVFQF